MKQHFAFSRASFAAAPTSSPAREEQVAARPRTAKMDAISKHASSNGRYAFDAACAAVGNVLKKAKA